MHVRIKDNSEEIKKRMEKAIERAIEAIGLTAVKHAVEIITNAPAVDTGRLRNSITYASEKRQNTSYSYSDDKGNSYTEKIGGGAKKGDLFIGTNVKYARGIEDGSHRKAGGVHYLQKAATNYSSEYKKLLEQSVKNG